MVLRELSSDLHCELESIACVLVDERVDAEGCWVFTIDAVVHHEELTVGGIDRHSFHGFEVARIDALMEVAVVEDDAALVAHG